MIPQLIQETQTVLSKVFSTTIDDCRLLRSSSGAFQLKSGKLDRLLLNFLKTNNNRSVSEVLSYAANYYNEIVESLLIEQPDDEIPELPSDAELNRLKIDTLIKVDKIPQWATGWTQENNEGGRWEIKGHWPLPDGHSIIELRIQDVMTPDYDISEDSNKNLLTVYFDKPYTNKKRHPAMAFRKAMVEITNDILKSFGFSSTVTSILTRSPESDNMEFICQADDEIAQWLVDNKNIGLDIGRASE